MSEYAKALHHIISTAKRDGRADDDIAESLDTNLRATRMDAEKLPPHLRDPMLEGVKLMERARDQLLNEGSYKALEELKRYL